MRSWGMKKNENSNSYTPTIKLTEEWGWVINITKESSGSDNIPINQYDVDIKEPGEVGKFDEKIMKIALAMQEILGMSPKL
jgi:hypothetical protein